MNVLTKTLAIKRRMNMGLKEQEERHAEARRNSPNAGRGIVAAIVEYDPKMQARKEFGEAIKAIQEDSVRNGTDKMTMDEIDAIIADVRREKGMTNE